jgi:hypothetical protein
MKAVETGIIASDSERLILRPFPLFLRRRALLRLVVGMFVAIAAFAALFTLLFRRHVDGATVIAVSLIAGLVLAWRITTQVTFIAMRDGDAIFVETRNRLLRWTRRSVLHRYGDIRSIALGSRVNPNAAHPGASPTGAYLHYDVVLETAAGARLLWYTRYRDCAEQIARRLSEFTGATVEDRR